MIRQLRNLCVVVALAIFSVCAQAQTAKMPSIGVLTLTAGVADPFVHALRQRLQELGHVEGKTMKMEFRTAQDRPERLPGLADELVRARVDVIVVTNPLAARELRRATSSIPIVVALFDPVAAGLVTDLAHPGSNVTGLSFMNIELGAKRLELLREVMPGVRKVAVLWNPDTPSMGRLGADLRAVASALTIDLDFIDVQKPEQIDAAFIAVSRQKCQAVYVVGDPLFYAYRKRLGELTVKSRLPGIGGSRHYADNGGLISYGASMTDQMRRAATYVDKILAGVRPGDLPIEQPTNYELVVNARTAKALGIKIPETVLLRADEVIQ